ncbi:MAG: glycosyltransferase family protein [Microbacterium gubbeenense]|uniref:glycosyltransferase family protein n=2 Tax=Microbacterium gubbeenense TaxID=159896 RepID=UPI000400BEF1|nr:glycosyltransferase [Microbacterium gubbeenense]
MSTRIVLFSHDSAGLGHIRRNLALAHALSAGSAEPVTGLLVAGRPEATRFRAPRGWDWLILPGVQHGEGGYVSRELDLDLEASTALRGGAFRAALSAFAPDLVVIDRHPFGVGGELEDGLRTLRAANPECRIVLGLRDVLDAPRAAAGEWSALGGAPRIRALFDAIWVYGDPRVHDLSVSGELPASLRDLVAHTGYLADGRVDGPQHQVDAPYLLTTVGGGIDGVDLAAAAAAAPVPEGLTHLIVTGPQMTAADRERVAAVATDRTSVVRRVPDALPLIRGAEAVVCMGGYNTICEVMSTETPALVAPRRRRRAEQGIRAAALTRAGVIETLSPWETDPETIGRWFAANAGRTISRAGVELDGLGRIPSIAADLLGSADASVLEDEFIAV